MRQLFIEGETVRLNEVYRPWVFVKSKTRRHRWHTVTPFRCECEGFFYRNWCRHNDLVRRWWGKWPELNPRVAEYGNVRSEHELDESLKEEWVPVAWLFGGDEQTTIPEASAEVIRQALEKMVERDEVSPRAPWLGLEYLAANYLAEGP